MSQTPEKKFRFRGLVSVTATISFIALAFSGVILFVVPPGRFVNSVGWSLLGLEKPQWQILHNYFAILFVLTAILHIYLNWHPLISYFKSQKLKRFAFRWDWIMALIICGLLLAGVIAWIPPFTTLSVWKEDLKHRWEENYYADLSRLPPPEHTSQMPDHQSAEGGQRPTPPVDGAEPGRGGGASRGRSSMGGVGQMTLEQFCNREGLELAAAIEKLQSRGIEADADMTLRALADQADMHPRDLRALLIGQSC